MADTHGDTGAKHSGFFQLASAGGGGKKRWFRSRHKSQDEPRELYRRFAAQLCFQMIGAERGTCLMLTSSGEPEVTAQVTLELAEVLATEHRRRVLVVDTHFEDGMLSSMLGMPRGPGFLDVLEGNGDRPALAIRSTGVPLVSFLPSGQSNEDANRAVMSENLGQWIAPLRDRFDFTLFSAPSVLRHSTAMAFPAHMDCVLLVMEARVTRLIDAKACKNALDACRAPRVGLILASR